MGHLRKAISLQVPQMGHKQGGKKALKPTNEGSNDADTQSTTGTKPTTNEVKTKGHIVIL